MATLGTTTELEIQQVQTRLAELEAKRAVEEEARAALTPRLRELAIHLHHALCPEPHGTLPGQCPWYTDARADDPALADWTEARHVYWALIAQTGVGLQVSLGWTVGEPTGELAAGVVLHGV